MIHYLRQLFNIPLAVIFALLLCGNLIGLASGVPSVIIAGVSVCVAFFYLRRGVRIDYPMLLFLIYLPIELLLSNPDSRFHSWERMVLFSLMMVSVSPLVQSEYARRFRLHTLQILIIVIVVASICSFFCYFLGVNLMVRNNTNEYVGIAGHFGGIFNHSMKLGPMASLASIFLTYKAFVTKRKWLFVLSSICACAVLFSASRGSFVALIGGTIFLMYKYSENRNHLIKIFLTTVVLLAITYPIWSGAMAGLEQKQAGNVRMGGTFTSRTAKWLNRISEFESSPLWGVGFSSIDPDAHEYWNKAKGIIEPGTSWLSILSMLGMVGFTLFMIIFKKAYTSVLNSTNNHCILLYSFLIFYSIHMITEGYIFAAGNPVCVFFWLLLACCYDTKYIKDKEYRNEDNLSIL